MYNLQRQEFKPEEIWMSGFDLSMEDVHHYGDAPGVLKIREEMSRFLLNLGQSQMEKSTTGQICHLYCALEHLDHLDREIRISSENDELLRIEMVHEKIRSLKRQIAGYIQQLEGNRFG